MPAERRKRLDAIGFVWDVLDSAWEEGLAVLATFRAREGHCRVPLDQVEGTFKLGQWVGVQRSRRRKMLAERKQRLDAIGFVWDVLDSAWEEGFAALATFRAREGHCRVPDGHVEGTLSSGVGSVGFAAIKTVSLLNAKSGWMPSGLFGNRMQADGKKALRH